MPDPSSELMNLVAGGAGAGGPPPSPNASPAGNSQAPVSAPLATPEPKQGEKQKALINVSLAMDLLEQSLGPIGSETEDGADILSVLSKLSKRFGETRNKSQELAPAQLMQMMHSLPMAGGMSPEMKALMGGGGKPPGGAPPGMPPAAPQPQMM